MHFWYVSIMVFEIELKARLDDFAPVKEQLSAEGSYCRSYTKSDSYWYPAQETMSIPSGVRIRREGGINADGSAHESVLVTYKIKEISGGIEVNNECEFSVSDAALFEELLNRLGLRMAVRKEKQGWAWLIPASVKQMASAEQPVLAELSLVEGLGWFLEIEIQAADNDVRTVEKSRNRLLALLQKLGIPEERIEDRPYTAMLLERGAG
ncbi:MAG: class IV adenylate cyclase [Treponema sp.]|nr:class IV adenylate cyclase [Treponema sp.]